MATTNKQYSFTTSLYQPLTLTKSPAQTTYIYPTPTNPHPPTNNPIFTDAMHIRDAVFVQEQGCRAEEEIDADDKRSWGWVVYACPQPQNPQQSDKKEEEEKKEPVGTIRVVPPPHIAHSPPVDTTTIAAATAATAATAASAGNDIGIKYDFQHEPYIKITRVAVLAPFRGYGVSRLMMRIVEDWASRNAALIDRMYDQCALECGIDDGQRKWNGLIGLHAQVQVERMYASMGYEMDESMGRWDEEGIEHVGMFKRVDVKSQRSRG